MTKSVAQMLNALPETDAREALARCCGSCRWVEAMVAARPYHSDRALLEIAERAWWDLEPDDWLEAFSHHPRICEQISEEAASTTERRWSTAEQSGMGQADQEVHDAMVAGNLDYETRFGHVFLICATGRSGYEMLMALLTRLDNDPTDELRVAAAEQAKITRIRLEKLVDT
ncbi:MAG: 2-oxo-4-hydroxy-4-carboxy-5-ureidoimidazoline decarboxylase [Gemmatimonadota bacterium]|nr:MAG: 2-oxo-4-hydroxy-4-carboxy-5-ureidoimidazoline decarboxylase [Gemmatimonadota bacterium]